MKRKKKRNNIKIIIIIIAILILFSLIISSILIGRSKISTENTSSNSNKSLNGKIVLDQDDKVNENEITEEMYENSIARFKEFASDYEKQTILPRNISVLYKYDGPYDRDDFYKNFKLYTDYVSYLKENVTPDNVDNFYSQNSSEIISVTGNDDIESFRNLIKAIQNKNVSVGKLRFARIQPQSSTTEKGYFKFKIDVFYGEENEQDETKMDKLTVEVSWAESKNLDKEFIYLVR